MTNTLKLLKTIKESGYKRQYIADRIGMTRFSLHKKVHNLSDWRADEIVAICEVLRIGKRDMCEIFFGPLCGK